MSPCTKCTRCKPAVLAAAAAIASDDRSKATTSAPYLPERSMAPVLTTRVQHQLPDKIIRQQRYMVKVFLPLRCASIESGPSVGTRSSVLSATFMRGTPSEWVNGSTSRQCRAPSSTRFQCLFEINAWPVPFSSEKAGRDRFMGCTSDFQGQIPFHIRARQPFEQPVSRHSFLFRLLPICKRQLDGIYAHRNPFAASLVTLWHAISHIAVTPVQSIAARLREVVAMEGGSKRPKMSSSDFGRFP